MRIGAFQFSSSGDIKENYEAISRGIRQARCQRVELLVFHECALLGYPPVQRPRPLDVDFQLADSYTSQIRAIAAKNKMHVALGTIRRCGGKTFNSLEIISPDGATLGFYDKRALWGWDLDNFSEGNQPGIFSIRGIDIGFRICFGVRFPEYFRELFVRDVKLCIVSFFDTQNQDNPGRYSLIGGHLATRAVENVMTALSVNNASMYQTAPTAVFDADGTILCHAPQGQDHLMVFDYDEKEPTFGDKGRIQVSEALPGIRKERRNF